MSRFRARMFDGSQALTAPCLALTAFLCGCGLRGNSELLEAQLRKQEKVIRHYESEATHLRNELADSQRELDLLRVSQASHEQSIYTEEESRSLARTQGLVFNSLLSGGQNHDDVQGDERFHAVFYPHDSDGEVVKLTGKLEVEAIDLSQPAEKKSLGKWEYGPEQSRQLWLNGFLSSGFQVDEMWNSPPNGSKVLLYARLTTLDGRTFEATHTISVEPSLAAKTPGTLPLPEKTKLIEQASFEVPEGTRLVPDPLPSEFASPPATAKATRPSGELPAKVELAPAAPVKTAETPSSPEEPKPFPSGVQTSDNLTEETFPIVR